MRQIPNSKPEGLEARTYRFALECRDLIKQVKVSITNREYCKQLARSSASVVANYIEANEALSKKDFIMRMKICRKEVKESRMWIRLLEVDESTTSTQNLLIAESTELLKIFSAIISKSS